MIIQCGKCLTRYHYDEERFGSALVKKIRCTKCSEIFEIRNPATPREEAPGRAPLMLSEDFTLDPTEMASEPRRRPVPSRSGPGAVDEMLSTIRGRLPTPTPPPLPSPGVRPPSPANQSTGEFPPVGGSSERPLKLPDWYRLSLACIAGPDSGRIFEIEKPKVTIGRVNAEVVLSDTQCSRQHALIEVMDDEAWLTDLGSTNGTFIGDRRITRHPLDNRAEFDVGTTTLMFLRTRKES
ncbi:MAG TPA: FHA domain-containing protein [Thermoanaerobaculia bacterium]|nr:FHA domain-containing protein [Thermoanaerobaculia bacterium]